MHKEETLRKLLKQRAPAWARKHHFMRIRLWKLYYPFSANYSTCVKYGFLNLPSQKLRCWLQPLLDLKTSLSNTRRCSEEISELVKTQSWH
jgi:hypothetical protein